MVIIICLKHTLKYKNMINGGFKINLGGMISDSLKYPFTNIKRALGLLLLLLGSFLIIPVFLAMGYLLRIIDNTINGSNELPPFDEWGIMLGDGFRYIAAAIIYLIIPTVLMILVVPWIITMYSGGFLIERFLLSIVIGLILFIPFRLLNLIAMGNMAKEGRLGAAFEFRKLLEFISEIGWLKYLAYIVVFSIIGDLFELISNAASFLQISYGLAGFFIGIIVSTLISIYLSLYGARFTGLIYLEGQRFTEDRQKSDINLESGENQDIGTV